MAVIFAYFIYTVENLPDNIDTYYDEHWLFILLFNLTMPVYFGALHIFYIVHAARNTKTGPMHTTWIVCIILFGVFAMPFYWYHYIWNEGRETGSSGPLQLATRGD